MRLTTEIDKLHQQAIAAERKSLQSDLWKLAHVLYPPPKYQWGESHHQVCESLFIKKDPDKSIRAQSKIKQRLFLDPRNHFKTTLDICDTVQWILCFPDIRVLIASGTRPHAIAMLGSVKAHFQYNPVIRDLFPELCPERKKIQDWGTQDSFQCPGRKERSLLQPTCSVASPDSAVASTHYDLLKFDDLVDETNSRTKDSLQAVIAWYKQTSPLLEPGGYKDVIGTLYSFDDMYAEILGEGLQQEDYLLNVEHERSRKDVWLVTKRGCYMENGDPLFPERCITKQETLDWLEKERDSMGSFLFSHHYLNKPVPGDSQFFPWPLIEKSFIARSGLPKQRTYFTTLDLAVSQSTDADNTAIVTCSVGFMEKENYPTLFVEHIFAGHFPPSETVSKLFDAYEKFTPSQMKTEDVVFSILLKEAVQAESFRRGKFLPMRWQKRDSREAKESRIAAMQTFFERGQIRIVKEVNHREQLVSELVRFPKYRKNDIIDALSDHIPFLNLFMYRPETQELPPLTARNGSARLGLMA